MNRTTTIAHRASVVLMGVGVMIATLDGFSQSYAGLHHWAKEKGLKEWKADSFPLLVDLFVLVGELGLFALALEGHRLTRKGLSWLDMALPFGLASAGWGVSLAFNVGAVDGDWTKQVTAAVAPIASMLGLLVLLRTVHRLITRTEHDQAPAAVDVAETVTAEPVPDGYAKWDELEPGTWERWPLPELPAGDDHDDEPPVPGVPADVLARAREEFSEHLQRGKVPGIRPIRRILGCGQPRAQQVREYLAVLAEK
ncbi:MAG TPA: DUF2637 domain-containing protein [Spirillospora sp.]|nr:DUF2637 domain-containing protein [Spirillospora sp.]